MYLMNSDYFDGFSALFTNSCSVIAGKEYPLGMFAARILETGDAIMEQLETEIAELKEEFTVFLSARDPSSGAITQQLVNRVWALFEELPLYSELRIQGQNARQLMRYMREHPDEVDDMLTDGTERNLMLRRWMKKLTDFPASLQRFRRETAWMLDEYFENLPSRQPEAYAQAYGRYRLAVSEEARIREEEKEEAGDIASIEIPQISVPVRLSFQPTTVMVKNKRKTVLAEQIIFEDLDSFLTTDLYRGMAAGNLPRRCHHCGRFFLVIGAYDTVYCERIAPGERKRTCRNVGAHRTEAKKNGTDLIRSEYSRVYTRLKARKNNGLISVDEWNRAVAQIQDMKAQAQNGAIGDVELKRRYDAI